MVNCSSCGETNEHTVLIPKPKFYLFENKQFHLIDGGVTICLECLRDELEQLKYCY